VVGEVTVSQGPLAVQTLRSMEPRKPARQSARPRQQVRRRP